MASPSTTMMATKKEKSNIQVYEEALVISPHAHHLTN
jgi:hypothetical protein